MLILVFVSLNFTSGEEVDTQTKEVAEGKE